jgi:hypothetical protein
MTKTIYYIIPFLFLSLSLVAEASTCVPSKYEETLRSICQDIKSFTKAEISKNEALSEKMIFDDCGLNSLIIFENNSPYTVIKYPMKPSEENILKLESLKLKSSENPFLNVAKQATEGKLVSQEIANFPNGYFSFNRTIWGLSCKTKDDLPVVVADSQIKTEDGTFIGSHILVLTKSMLKDASLLAIVDPFIKSEVKEKEIVKLATKILEGSYQKTASALRIPPADLRSIVDARIHSKEFLEILQSKKENTTLNARSILGLIVQDIERTVGGAREIKFPEIKKIQDLEKKIEANENVNEEIKELKLTLNEIRNKLNSQEIKVKKVFGFEENKIALIASLFSLVLSIAVFIHIFLIK